MPPQVSGCDDDDDSTISSFRLPPQRREDIGKLTVVLDIDETLIHSDIVENTSLLLMDEDNTNIFYLQVGELVLRVQKRPYLDSFLEYASTNFELIAFTAGSEDYATSLLDVLDPHGKIFRHRLFRQHCFTKYISGCFIKDLRICNRDLARTVLVDNNTQSFLFQLENGIPIASFFNDDSDRALIVLGFFLEQLKDEKDVTLPLVQIFRLHMMLGDLPNSFFMNCN